MLKQNLFLLFLVLTCYSVFAQNIGVGTSTPAEKLHVAGTLRVDDLQTSIAASAVTDKMVWVDANGKVYSFPAGTPGKILGVNGAGLITWLDQGMSNTLNNGQIWIGDVSNTAQPQTLSGDAVVSNMGVVTIQDNAVDGTDITISGESNGSLMYFNGTDWVNLGVGTPGQVLTISGGIPAWVNLPAAPTFGNLTTSTAGVTVTGGTGAVVGAGTTVNVATNALNQNGLVTGPSSLNANQVWGTNGLGVPGWITLANDDWHITGNSGTTPATNFIGTTDAQDFVVKTSGSLASNERMRVIGSGATPGQVVVNNTGIFAGDAFSVYSNNSNNGSTASINNAIGTFAVNGYAAGNGTGVYGEVNGGASTAGTAVWGNLYGTATTASSTSEAVWGTNNTAPAGTGVTAAVATGVRGEASGTAGTAFTMGVLGVNTGLTGSAFGVYGQTSSPAAMGVFGVNLDVTAAPSHGIQGQTGATGSAAGVRGINSATAIGNAQNGFGVRGSANVAPTGTGFVMGVRGDASGATGSTYGVYGQSASPNGFGMDAVNTNVNGTGLLVIGNNAAGTFLTGGSGIAANGNAIGTFSIAKTAANGIGVVAVGNNLTGSIFTPSSGSGIAATGTQYGVVGYATTTVNTNGSSNQTLNGLNGSSGGYFEIQSAAVSQTWAYVGVRDNGGVNRKIIGPGTVNTIVNDLQGNRVALSCPETPENLFQDYGQGRLINGHIHIDLDPVFAKNIVVSERHPLRVFIQLEGNCQGVYVENKTGTGFDVSELNGGTSNTPFTYTVVANRADEMNPDGSYARYSEERFPAAPGPLPKVILETSQDNENVRNVVQDSPVIVPEILKKPSAKRKK
ncbi:MAG: hypothetical protein K1X92_03630 [Bacteroidia bacterium]|nr:hypothetical protein [Bacteroidia bacterium]